MLFSSALGRLPFFLPKYAEKIKNIQGFSLKYCANAEKNDILCIRAAKAGRK
jgi:hypothetical protein